MFVLTGPAELLPNMCYMFALLLLLLLLPHPPPPSLYCRVGDTFVFGQSSRMFVLTGPAEFMPQEGLNRQQRKQLQLLEAAQVREDIGAESPGRL
jgi:hypothetical protein